MSSPRGQSGLMAKILASALASASNIWSRPGLDLVVLLCNWAFFRKNRVKFGNFVNFSGNNLKSYVVNHYLVLFIIIFGLGLGLNLQKLASASASRFWPRLTSVVKTYSTLIE